MSGEPAASGISNASFFMTPDPQRRPDRTALERQQRRRLKLKAGCELMFESPDWASFLRPDRLPQKAGCPPERLRAMILKELADNALDAGDTVTVEQVDADTWVVADDGPGLDRGRIAL